MELLTGSTAFARFVADHLEADVPFRLLDVGCAGGVHPAFYAFGDRLRAWAFDIDGAEVVRLQATEASPGVRYIHGNIALPDGHPFLKARSVRPPASASPWSRLSVAATLRLRNATRPTAPAAVSPAPPESVDLASFFEHESVRDLDFVKIDVDGEDFGILSGLGDKLEAMDVLGVGIEVNYFGTDHPTDHTLHNVDRFMRRHGYDLFGLTVRHYSMAALPSRYVIPGYPAQTRFGRPLQGDALYMRDPCAPAQQALAERMAPGKLAKLAAIFSIADLSDCAAEILTTLRTRLEGLLDVDAGLDLLTTAARENGMPMRYAEYVKAFADDAACFYAQTPPPTPQESDEALTGPYEPECTQATPTGGNGVPMRHVEDSKADGSDPDALRAEMEQLQRTLSAVRSSRAWRIRSALRRVLKLPATPADA